MALAERTDEGAHPFVKQLSDFLKEAVGSHSKRAVSSKARMTFLRDFVHARVDAPIALVGAAGTMGFGLLMEWIKIGLPSNSFVVVDPKQSRQLMKAAARERIPCYESVDQIERASVLFLAIKPQDASTVLPRLRRLIGNRTLIISIMAGKSIQFISRTLDHQNPGIVRAMPNLPGTIGHGITAAVANSAVAGGQAELAELLLLATGKVVWVEESLMNAVTAVSGSGPAYTFLLAECLAIAGESVGLPPRLATTLAHETVAGSGELLHRSTQSAASLRANVTSPGGTTAAALDVLMGPHGLQLLMKKAVEAATRRAQELGE